MPSYKLTYFDLRGRAELTRLVFALAGTEYEDCRINGEEWQKLKPSVATGALPTLEVDGVVLNQSMAIARYAAAQFKLGGSTNLEAAQCDGVIETFVECQNSISGPIFAEKDETKKAELKKSLFAEKAKPTSAILEKMLVTNGGVVFVGKTITVADLALYAFMDGMCGFLGEDVANFSDYPKLCALKEKVANDPKIAAWLAKRPVTTF